VDGVPGCGRRGSADRDQLAAFESPPDDEDDDEGEGDGEDDGEEEDEEEESFDGAEEDESLVPEPEPLDDEPLAEGSAAAAALRLSVR
jgi:hypothetical protein